MCFAPVGKLVSLPRSCAPHGPVPGSKCLVPCHWQWMSAARRQRPPRSRSPARCCCVLARGSCFRPHTPCSSCCVWCWISKKYFYLCTTTEAIGSMGILQTTPKLCCASNKLMLWWERCAWARVCDSDKTSLTSVDILNQVLHVPKFTPKGDRSTGWNQVRTDLHLPSKNSNQTGPFSAVQKSLFNNHPNL